MRGLILAISASTWLVASCVEADAQGQVGFFNRVPPEIDYRVVLRDGTGVGAGWTAELFAAPGADQPASNLIPVPDSRTQFRTGAGAGYFSGNTPFIPGAFWETTATVQMRVFDPNGQLAGQSPQLNVLIATPPVPPENIPFGVG